MAEELKEEKLDSPLVVHHKNDASYQETASEIELNETHEEEEKQTLERHRFKKDKMDNNKKGVIIVAIIVVLCAVFCGLYFTDNISFDKKQNTVTHKQTTTESTTNLLEEYKNTIVVKNTYIFVDGLQVDGIDGLQKALKYVDPAEEPYRIINVDAQGDFFNYEVLPLLMELGFYDENTQIEHRNLTELMAKEEIEETLKSTHENTTNAVSSTTDKTE